MQVKLYDFNIICWKRIAIVSYIGKLNGCIISWIYLYLFSGIKIGLTINMSHVWSIYIKKKREYKTAQHRSMHFNICAERDAK